MNYKKTVGVVMMVMTSGSWRCKIKCCLLLLTSFKDNFVCLNTLCNIEEEMVSE